MSEAEIERRFGLEVGDCVKVIDSISDNIENRVGIVKTSPAVDTLYSNLPGFVVVYWPPHKGQNGWRRSYYTDSLKRLTPWWKD